MSLPLWSVGLMLVGELVVVDVVLWARSRRRSRAKADGAAPAGAPIGKASECHVFVTHFFDGEQLGWRP